MCFQISNGEKERRRRKKVRKKRQASHFNLKAERINKKTLVQALVHTKRENHVAELYRQLAYRLYGLR